jgi:hypothetical protein
MNRIVPTIINIGPEKIPLNMSGQCCILNKNPAKESKNPNEIRMIETILNVFIILVLI